LVEKLFDLAGILVVLGSLYNTLKLLNLALSYFVCDFATQAMDEVNASKGSGDNWVDGVANTMDLNLSTASNVGKDITLPKFN
jgi:hypothetical protein